MGVQSPWCSLETVHRKLLQHVTSFSKKNPPPEVGVVAGAGRGGGHGVRGVYTAEPISQTRFPLSLDQLCKRWRFCIRNLKQLARVSSLGDACHFGINVSLQAGYAGCFISVPSPPSAARLQFAVMRTARVHQVEWSGVAAACGKG